MARNAARPMPRAPFMLPADVRLMNVVAIAVYAATALALLVASVLWLTRSPGFVIRSIQLEGEFERNSINTIRANAMPRLMGSFFSVDLQRSRSAFEAVPWVRHAVVRRVWPNQLAVWLEEHRAVALWQGDDSGDRLVNQQGEVFEANVGDVEEDALPMFSGPESSAADMLSMYRRLVSVFAPLRSEVDSLTLSVRGSWRVVLASGATVELGRGSEDEIIERTTRFVATLDKVYARYRQALEYADLRHADGYAVRLRGVTTGAAASTKN